jgi:hypothetical protein
LKDRWLPDAFTVTFNDGDAMLTYQIREDFQAIRIIDLIWVE